MLTIQQKAQCVLLYHKLKSPLQYNIILEMSLDKTLLTLTALRDGLKNFMETGSILDHKRSGRPSIYEETVDAVHVAFHHSPRKSICVRVRVRVGLTCKYILIHILFYYNKVICSVILLLLLIYK